MLERDIKRFFDFLLALVILITLLIPMLFIAVAVRMTSAGPALFWSDRVGLKNKIFRMPKFRTMKLDTPTVATHLLDNPSQFRTAIGAFLRKSSLDELPQIFSILVGDMSFVGPRPALYNQDDLIQLRTVHDIHKLTPGLTGWAQVNGRDELPIPEKVIFDREYLMYQNFGFDVKILWLTIIKVFLNEGITH